MKNSRIKGTYMKYSIISSLLTSVLLLAIIGIYEEMSLYHVFIGFKVAHIPLSLIVLGIGMMVGAIIGFFIDLYVNRSINDLTRALLELERGNFSYKFSNSTFKEFKDIEKQFYRLSQKTEKQALMIQKNTNDRVNREQEILETAISQERNRLARELHDSVSQQLFAISMMCSALNESLTEESSLTKNLQVLEQMSVQAQGEMRALLLHLRPIQLEGKKLTEGVAELLTELSAKQHLEIKWYTDSIELEKGVEDHLFRILQEAISNTLRHAKAKRLEVRLRKIESFAIMKVIDDGIGFDTKIRKAGCYGIGSMEERVSEVGGILKIISVPHAGTQIEIKIPLKKVGDGLSVMGVLG